MSYYVPSIVDFRARLPEFERAADTLVNASLAAAMAEVDPLKWGYAYGEAVLMLAAHKLALSPQGQGVRMVAKDGTTTYGRHFDDLAARFVAGPRLV